MFSDPQDHSLKKWPSLNFILTGSCNTKVFNISSKPSCGSVKGAECMEGVVGRGCVSSFLCAASRPCYRGKAWLVTFRNLFARQRACSISRSIYMHSNIPAAILHKCQHQCCLIALFPPSAWVSLFWNWVRTEDSFRIVQKKSLNNRTYSDWYFKAKYYFSFVLKTTTNRHVLESWIRLFWCLINSS